MPGLWHTTVGSFTRSFYCTMYLVPETSDSRSVYYTYRFYCLHTMSHPKHIIWQWFNACIDHVYCTISLTPNTSESRVLSLYSGLSSSSLKSSRAMEGKARVHPTSKAGRDAMVTNSTVVQSLSLPRPSLGWTWVDCPCFGAGGMWDPTASALWLRRGFFSSSCDGKEWALDLLKLDSSIISEAGWSHQRAGQLRLDKRCYSD